MTAADLLALPRRELMALLARGHAIDPRALDDSQYRGTSLGLPAVVERLTWKTFRKVFHRDPRSGRLRGWNVRLRQGPGPATPMMRDGAPRTFGHYAVRPLRGQRLPVALGDGLLLDYGRLRDPLVALAPGRTDLLLGWSFLDLGLGQLRTPSFFALEREGPLDYVPPA